MRELLRQALDAICEDSERLGIEVAQKIRAALAQPDAEPVAWQYRVKRSGIWGNWFTCEVGGQRAIDGVADTNKSDGQEARLIYANPPAQPAPAVPDDMVMVPREPTQEMIDAADAIDPDQFWSEPLIQEDGTKHRTRDCDSVLYYRAMISAAPAVRKRLTDEQIDAISLRDGGVTYRQLARAIERAHGITGDSNG